MFVISANSRFHARGKSLTPINNVIYLFLNGFSEHGEDKGD